MEANSRSHSKQTNIRATKMTTATTTSSYCKAQRKSAPGPSHLSSFLFVAFYVALISLSPFEGPLTSKHHSNDLSDGSTIIKSTLNAATEQSLIESLGSAIRNVFREPALLRRCNSVMLAEAKVLGKMAKVWYIKKKIKKLSKKLKKHTIAVPVITAIPIYEHSYYPSPHVTHMTHGGMHHAASSYAPVSQVAAVASPAAQGHLAAAASNTYHSMLPYRGHGGGQHHQIINNYQPSPPLYVDDNGGIYGHYGNAYGRYDGGYHLW